MMAVLVDIVRKETDAYITLKQEIYFLLKAKMIKFLILEISEYTYIA